GTTGTSSSRTYAVNTNRATGRASSSAASATLQGYRTTGYCTRCRATGDCYRAGNRCACATTGTISTSLQANVSTPAICTSTGSRTTVACGKRPVATRCRYTSCRATAVATL